MDQFKLFLKNLLDPNILSPKNRLRDECVYTIMVNLDERIENLYGMESSKCNVFSSLYDQASYADA